MNLEELTRSNVQAVKFRVNEELMETCLLPSGVGIIEILSSEQLLQVSAQLDLVKSHDSHGNFVVPITSASQILTKEQGQDEDFQLVCDIIRSISPPQVQCSVSNLHFDSLKAFLFVQYFARSLVARSAADIVWPRDERLSEFSLELPVDSPRNYDPDFGGEIYSPRSGKRQSRSFVEQKAQMHFQLLHQYGEFMKANLRIIALLCLDQIPIKQDKMLRADQKAQQQKLQHEQLEISELYLEDVLQLRLGNRQLDRLQQYCQKTSNEIYPHTSDQSSAELSELNGGSIVSIGSDPIRQRLQREGGITIEGLIQEFGRVEWVQGQKDGAGKRSIEDINRGTLVLGQDELGLEGQLRVIGCRDVVVYALSCMQHVLVKGCSGCTICIGAVAGIIRIEDCQKVELHVACKRILLSSCQQCTVYLGTEEKPVIIGDSRFLVFAPHNSPYEFLQRHVLRAQISTSANKWNQIHYTRRVAANGSRAGSTRGQLESHSFLPSEKFLPFYVPFRGAEGPLAGGASSRSKGLQPPLFPLPGDFEKAMNKTLKTVEVIRERTKAARASDARASELQATIQQHFREWMIMTGRIKQIQDLAKLERDKLKRNEGSEDRK
eukprot:TRINITY_DN11278_c0_g2_i6.p1 TRINITY_DN11278_c0_g2~~TRINITY_DN11278_c0_g2_i6.p1  ORF type:complete len:607 (+),score=36.83 TRINITY_DN11278_c0_g2_i6:265-2085(+)